MNIQTRPWLIASSVGAGVQMLLGLALGWGLGFITPRLLAQASVADVAALNVAFGAARLCLCGTTRREK